jgi:hypothetical protein
LFIAPLLIQLVILLIEQASSFAPPLGIAEAFPLCSIELSNLPFVTYTFADV